MKRHVKHLTLGGVIAPIILALGAVIGNAAQTALGFDFHGTALAIFLVGFFAGVAFVMHGNLKVEAAQIASEIDVGKVLGSFAGGLFGGLGEESPATDQSPSPLAGAAAKPAIDPPPPPPAP